MLKRATCLSCEAELRLVPLGFAVDFAPYEIECGSCGKAIETTFAYRVRYCESVVHRVLLIASVPFSIWLALSQTQYDTWMRIALAAVGPLAFGVGLGFVLSKIFALPTQLLIDKLRKP